ncbi:hypothetical protein [uncultured Croceitalea sp.]|uniref:hypothetical protein n=1 Tax=uncultured Croceitalea sp. TaxID=1798908 RepID=UPI00374ED780
MFFDREDFWMIEILPPFIGRAFTTVLSGDSVEYATFLDIILNLKIRLSCFGSEPD